MVTTAPTPSYRLLLPWDEGCCEVVVAEVVAAADVVVEGAWYSMTAAIGISRYEMLKVFPKAS
jgi:hypothetical protein